MLLSLHSHGAAGIRACGVDRVVFSNGEARTTSFLLTGEGNLLDWSIADIDELKLSLLSEVLSHKPDVFLLGCGPRQVFPAAEIMAACWAQRVGIEVMDNSAASRTFNVLSSEGRNVLLGMILPASNAA